MSLDALDRDPLSRPVAVVELVFAGRVGEFLGLGRYAVSVHRGSHADALAAALDGAGFRCVPQYFPYKGEPAIRCGGAPPEVIETIRSLVHEVTGIALPVRRIWGKDDLDIWIPVD